MKKLIFVLCVLGLTLGAVSCDNDHENEIFENQKLRNQLEKIDLSDIQRPGTRADDDIDLSKIKRPGDGDGESEGEEGE